MQKFTAYSTAFLSFMVFTLFIFLSPSFAQEGLVVNDPIAPATDLNLPFGALAIGKTSSTHIVTIKNTTSASITLPELKLKGGGLSAFTLDLVNAGADSCGLGTIFLDAAASCSVAVTFVPDLLGDRSAFLEISTQETQIAFRDGATRGISLFNLETGEKKQLTFPEADVMDDSPTWSASRGQIAFHRFDPALEIHTVYTVGIDGSGESLVAVNADLPDWSPDGRKIIYRDPTTGGLRLHDFNSNFFTVSFIGNAGSGESWEPSWSPDSQTISYRRDPVNQGSPSVYAINDDGSAFRFVALNAWTPSWSPSGDVIAYSDGDTEGISTAKADGSGAIASLTSPPGAIDFNPSWSPDEAQVIFERGVERRDPKGVLEPTPHQLIVIDVANPANATILPILGNDPDWSPSLFSKLTFSGEALPSTTNSPPSAPQLLSPEDKASGLGTSVTFKWLGVSDPDGDNVTYTLDICPESNIGCVREELKKPQISVSIVGFTGSGIVLAGMLFLPKPRKVVIKNVSLLILIVSVSALIACGGSSGGGNDGGNEGGGVVPGSGPGSGSGGGTGPGGSTPGSEISRTVNNLLPNTSYTWWVTAIEVKDVGEDQNRTSSVVRKFTTGP